MAKVQRKLTTIFAADVVGFSKMMGADEDETLARLKDCRAIIDALIAQYEGRIFGSAGDSVLAEFVSPVAAVQCAVDCQNRLAERDAQEPERAAMQFRIGINIGDVIVEADNLYGDGVNIAARLESIASPGGVCVAAGVYAEVRKKLNGIGFSHRGSQTLKNIEDPIDVYDVSLGQTPASKHNRAAPAQQRAGANDKPVVIVEPIRTIGGDERIAVLAAGLCEGIAASLTKSSAIVVVRNSTAAVPGEGAGAVVPGASVRFKVSGSIQAAGAKLRIFIALENALTGAQIRSERYDRTIDDIFQIQDEIVSLLNVAIRYGIKEAAFEKLAHTSDAALSIQELLDKAAGHLVRLKYRAIDLAEKPILAVLAKEPKNSMALSMRALVAAWRWDCLPYPVAPRDYDAVLEMLDASILLDERNYFAKAVKAQVLGESGAFKDSLRIADGALRMFPDLAEAREAKVWSAFQLNGSPENLDDLKKWIWKSHLRALALFAADRETEALHAVQLLFDANADIAYHCLCGAAILCAYTDEGARSAQVMNFVAKHPGLNAGNCRRPVFGDENAAARFEAGLRRIWP